MFACGFEKIALDDNVKKLLAPLAVGLGVGIPSAMVGGGLGLIARARFEKKMLKDSEKTDKDKAIHYLPHALGAAGFLTGAGVGLHHLYKYKDIAKTASLKKEVKLKPHQEEAIEAAKANNGSLLMAHATGTGKTLTGIATFEKLKEEGKANRAVVVVPAGLRSNFLNKGIKAFTNSSVSVYGPKDEAHTKNIGDKSKADYNIVSYELFREHGDKVLEDTGADTLIMDEVHRARATEGATYNKLRDLRSKVKNAITLTGSVVNNAPNDVVPLMDITYNPTGHKLVSKDFFDKLFVQKDAKTSAGFLSSKTVIEKKLKNKPQLAKYLGGKIHYIAHDAIEKDMPDRKLVVEEVGMTQPQKDIYDFSMSSVDPMTRWKIRNNIPVGQKEAKDAFAKLLQARQVSTDPGILDKDLAAKPDPAEYSPKIRKVVSDIESHIKHKDNKTVVFGNLLEGQLKSVEKSLKHRGIPYATFYGVGNEGNSAKMRDKSVEDFQRGDKQVLLISGAGAEGLDLKNANMMQVLEGHYNPERIQQAEARVRRMGSPLKEVTIKRYITVPKVEGKTSVLGSIVGKIGSDKGVDHWIYSIAKDKDQLNSEFRDVLKSHEKTANKKNDENLYIDPMSIFGDTKDIEDNLPPEIKAIAEQRKSLKTGKLSDFKPTSNDEHLDTLNRYKENRKKLDDFQANYVSQKNMEDAYHGMLIGNAVGGALGAIAAIPMNKAVEQEAETQVKQKLLDKGYESLTGKKHFKGIMAESKIDERVIDATKGAALIAGGLQYLNMLRNAKNQAIQKINPLAVKPSMFEKVPVIKKLINPNNLGYGLASGAIIGLGGALAVPVMKKMLIRSAMSGNNTDLDKGIEKYREKALKKAHRKYKSSKGYVQEYETKEELGIEHV